MEFIPLPWLLSKLLLLSLELEVLSNRRSSVKIFAENETEPSWVNLIALPTATDGTNEYCVWSGK